MSFASRATLALALVVGCGRQEQPTVIDEVVVERSEHFVVNPTAEAPSCPMKVEGAGVTLTPVRGGAALVFTSHAGATINIRQATRRLAALYDSQLPLPEKTGRAARSALQPSPLGIATRVEYSDVAAGARMEVTAIAPHDVRQLRKRLRVELLRMQDTRRCTLDRNSSPELDLLSRP